MDYDRLLRLHEVLKIIPVSKAQWWKKVSEGYYPQPIKISPRVTCWRYSEVIKLVQKSSEAN